MKRSTCLSALLVGLSLTMASAAVAAPPKRPTKGVKTNKPADAKAKPAPTEDAAQPAAPAPNAPATDAAQPADPNAPAAPSNGGNPPAPSKSQNPPTAAPTDPSAPTTPAAQPQPAQTDEQAPATTPATPAVTLGTTPATASDQPQTAPAEPAAPPAPRKWAGTSIFTSTSTSTATVFKNQQLSSIPAVDSSVYLLPRYLISDAFQLRGRLIFSYNWSNSSETVSKHEPRFSDTTLQLFYRKIPEVATVKPLLAFNAGIPTSPESRARTMVFNPGATLQLTKTLEHVLGGDWLFLHQTSYYHPIYTSTTPQIRNPAPYAFQCVNGTSCQDQLSGTFNTSDSLTYAFLVSAEWGKFNPALYYLGGTSWAYTPKDISANDVQPGLGNQPIGSSTTQGSTNLRQIHYFSAWLDYNWNAWFTTEVGYWMQRAALTANGTYGNPFFDQYQDMRVYLGANFSVDNLIKELEGGSAAGGIVRAKNTKTPMWTF